MKTFRVTYRDVDTGEFSQLEVNQIKATECVKKQGTSQGLYLGSAYITGHDVKKIQEIIPESARIETTFCGNCEKGWIIGRNGAYPCSCNTKGQDEVRKYAESLRKQGIEA